MVFSLDHCYMNCNFVDLGRSVEQAKWISIDHALTISNPKRIRSSEPKKTTKKTNVEQRNRSGQIRLVTCNWLGMSVFLWLVFEPNVNSVSFIYQRFSVVNFRMPFISFVCWSLSLILKSALIDNDLAINIVYVLSLIDGAFQLDRLCVFTFSQALNLIRFNTLHLQPILPCLFFSTSFHQYSPDRHFIPIFFPSFVAVVDINYSWVFKADAFSFLTREPSFILGCHCCCRSVQST